ncbi:tRNA lysidine(34) synthetase TilS [Spongiivirga citrea]|uniref:tRNA(Ile)-lysidine synthase n=1 Tax=Spongiivirga citrea TaxID=1481457 RepID=A0A6M0CEU7_9FLAO|nr:tRNA lysidine(34) synthetase TilS [Spongiivirga citrea]NER16358.1 tRNA lysidine(34) synthetase TilS [Spongiivirga citrea]
MKTAFSDHIDTNFPFLKKGKLLIAVSGGLDSVVLTHLLHSLSLDCTLAHCNFKLRGEESDADEAFVIALGETLNFEVFTQSFNTDEYASNSGISIQMAARELRYDWFYDLSNQFGFDAILTAHHANDNLETLLINLTRSTGIEGLLGIPEQNNSIVRPLLSFDRKEIEEYAKKHELEWREDASNSDEKYFRNAIRHHIIPELEKLNPRINRSVKQTQEHLADSWQLVEDRIEWLKNELEPEWSDGKLKIDKLKELSNTKAYLYYLLKDYGFTEWDDVVGLLSTSPGKKVTSRTHTLLKDRDYLILKAVDEVANGAAYLIEEGAEALTEPVLLQITTDNTIINESNSELFVDKETLKFPLTLRKWEKGDYFYPLGMQGKKKKLSKFFKDEKYSLFDKQAQWLLCSDEKIVWVVGKRADDRFKVTEKTTTVLKFKQTE